jgi:hypothetical protein
MGRAEAIPLLQIQDQGGKALKQIGISKRWIFSPSMGLPWGAHAGTKGVQKTASRLL